jgi:hypothetical protein
MLGIGRALKIDHRLLRLAKINQTPDQIAAPDLTRI